MELEHGARAATYRFDADSSGDDAIEVGSSGGDLWRHIFGGLLLLLREVSAAEDKEEDGPGDDGCDE